MWRKKIRGILSIFLVCSMVLAPNYVSADSEQKSNILVEKLTVSNTNYYGVLTIAKNSSKKITISTSPKKADNKVLKWESSDDTIVTVSNQGIIKGKKKGKADIIVSTTDGSNLIEKIPIIVDIPVKSIATSKKRITIDEGKIRKVVMSVQPEDATDSTLIYRSSNKDVATVSVKGEIQAISEGKATISANAKDGSGKRAIVFVTVKGIDVSQTLTDKDIVDGKITLSNKILKNLVIESSVGDAEITLNHVTIRGTLEMANDAKYTVYAKNSDINKVVALEDKVEDIISFAINENEATTGNTPTFVAEEGTLVVSVDARGNVSVKQGNTALIGTVTVNRNIDGSIELKLEGFSGNLVVNTTSNADIAITTTSCNIAEATISGTSSGQKLSLTDNTDDGKQSTINKINVETNASLKIDVPAKQLVVADTVDAADITIEKPIGNIVNNGKATDLSINSDVTNIISNGEEFVMKVAAGSKVTSVESTGADSKIEVALGSSINNIVSTGNSSVISGSGVIMEVKVEGNNTVVNNSSATVTVGTNVIGTTSNGAQVSGGTSVNTNTNPPQGSTTTPNSNPNPTPTPTPVPIPQTGTVIAILDPGKIWAGATVQMKADLKNITWSVYNNIDDTYAYAVINEETGFLQTFSTGIVRVVATSKLNNKVYGAVDVTICAKKFVGYEPLNPVIINTDINISDSDSLQASGLMPNEVNLIYETGNGVETETITVELNNWWDGIYDGNIVGIYPHQGYINVPAGYERPSDLSVTVNVQVNTKQTDLRKVITGFTNPLEEIVISTDKNIIYTNQLFNAIIRNQSLQLHCIDSTEVTGYITGWSSDSANQFNGAVPGTYIVDFVVNIPDGYMVKKEISNNSSINWYYNDIIIVPVKIIVAVGQTAIKMEEEFVIPDATQAKFTVEQKVATIGSVSLLGAPSTVSTLEEVNFRQYLTVETDSQLASDHRVIWTIDNSYFELDSITGIVRFREAGVHTITATSVIDKTKKASITVNAINSKSIVHFEAFAQITISQDFNICNFTTLYNSIKNDLPTMLLAEDNLGKMIQIPISGWRLINEHDNIMVIAPQTRMLYGYASITLPTINVTLAVTQTDNRIKVASASLVKNAYTLAEDKYAVTEGRLFDSILGDLYNSKVSVNAKLEDDSSKELECSVQAWRLKWEELPDGFYGLPGNVTICLGLNYPEGYRASVKHISGYDLWVEITVQIEVEQTPRYEQVWVTQKPKMTYNAGDTIDLSQLTVRVRDTSQIETVSDIYIGYNNFDLYGIQLRLGNGTIITSKTVLTPETNGFDIFVHKTNNQPIRLGRLTVAPNIITAFNTNSKSAGAVNGLYFNNAEAVKATLPSQVTTTGEKSVSVPVLEWVDTDGYRNEAGSYTFTAALGTLPAGYVLGAGVTATIEIIVAETLSIISIKQPDAITIPLGASAASALPNGLYATLSDEVTNGQWLEVNWNLSGINSAVEGIYTIEGTIVNSVYTNPAHFIPSINVTVDFDESASMDDIDIVQLPSKLLYKTEESLDTTGLKVISKYSDGSVVEVVTGAAIGVVSGSAIIGFDSSTTGFKEITVSYQDKTDTFKVYVDSINVNYTVLFVTDANNMMTMVATPHLAGFAVEPTKPGFVFGGWYTNPNGTGEAFTIFTIIINDMVVYAKWNTL